MSCDVHTPNPGTLRLLRSILRAQITVCNAKPLLSTSVPVGLFLCCTEELKVRDGIPARLQKPR